MTTNFARRLAVLLVTGALVAGPALSQELIVGHTDAPKQTGKNPTIADEPDPLPPGTPTDDYEFMGWCTGILTGHMDLYTRVKPELEAISKRWNSVDEDAKQEADQQIEGRSLLNRFHGVMSKAEAQKPSLAPSGQEAIKKGLANWSKIDTVDKQTQAYSWMNFGLPIQCETTVAALEKTPIVVGKPAATATAKATRVVAEKPKAKTLRSVLLGDEPPPPADGKEPLIAPGHLAPYGKSVVAELAAQKAAEKAAKKAKADAEKAKAADNAGLRQ